MRLTVAVSVVVLAISASTFAQERKPNAVDISGGYSFGRDSGVNDHGFSAELAGNVTHVFAIVGNVYTYWTSRSFAAQGIDVDANTFFYGVGPRVFSRNASPAFRARTGPTELRDSSAGNRSKLLLYFKHN